MCGLGGGQSVKDILWKISISDTLNATRIITLYIKKLWCFSIEYHPHILKPYCLSLHAICERQIMLKLAQMYAYTMMLHWKRPYWLRIHIMCHTQFVGGGSCSELAAVWAHTYTYAHIYTLRCTYTHHWKRPYCLCIRILYKVVFFSRKRATNYMALLQKMIYEDKAPYDSAPPCTGWRKLIGCLKLQVMFH